MVSHFIKDTNEQYSIREDGKIFSHYINKCNGKYYRTIEVIAMKDKLHKEYALGTAQIYYNGKVIKQSVKKLLLEYFNIHVCNNCGKKTENSQSINRHCEQCNEIAHAQGKIEYRKKFHKLLSEQQKVRNQKARKELLPIYIAQTLNIPISELTDELYNLHKNTIAFKRQLSKEHNISIYKLK